MIDERAACLRIDKSRRLERTDVGIARFRGVAEHHLEMGVCRECLRIPRSEEADVNAFVNRLEQPCEGVSAVVRQGYFPAGGAGVGVSVLGKRGR